MKFGSRGQQLGRRRGSHLKVHSVDEIPRAVDDANAILGDKLPVVWADRLCDQDSPRLSTMFATNPSPFVFFSFPPSDAQGPKPHHAGAITT
jgi:hypothetical protein